MMRKGENIETYLTRLISEADGVRPEEVTVEYIRQQREKRIYPDTRFEPTDYGLFSFTRRELDKIEMLADEFMRNF